MKGPGKQHIPRSSARQFNNRCSRITQQLCWDAPLSADPLHANIVAENQIAVGGPIERVNILSLGKHWVCRRRLATCGWKHVQILRALGLDGRQSFSVGRESQSRITIGIPSDRLDLIGPLSDESDL